MDLPVEVRLLIWRYVIPEEVEIDVFQGDELATLPSNPALPILFVCHQGNSEIRSISTVLVARLHSQDCPWWLRKTSWQYKSHFKGIKVRNSRPFLKQDVRSHILACQPSDRLATSELEQHWRNVSIRSYSGWTFSEHSEHYGSYWYLGKMNVELEVSGLVRDQGDNDAVLAHEGWVD